MWQCNKNLRVSSAVNHTVFFLAPPDNQDHRERAWLTVEQAGDPEVFPRFFVGPAIPVLVQGWGLQGSDEAVAIFGRRSDGSLFWRGLLVSQAALIQ